MARKKPKLSKRRRLRPKSSQTVREYVKTLRASGFSEDRIAHELDLSKNTLRARHAPDLDEGREIARAEAETAERAKLSARGKVIWDTITAGFGTEWQNADGSNDLQFGAHTIAESFEMYLKRKRHTVEPHRNSDADLVAIANIIRNLEKKDDRP